MGIKVDKSYRGRMCHLCPDTIQPGKKLIVFQSNSFYSQNCCIKCFNKLHKELNKK